MTDAEISGAETREKAVALAVIAMHEESGHESV